MPGRVSYFSGAVDNDAYPRSASSFQPPGHETRLGGSSWPPRPVSRRPIERRGQTFSGCSWLLLLRRLQ